MNHPVSSRRRAAGSGGLRPRLDRARFLTALGGAASAVALAATLAPAMTPAAHAATTTTASSGTGGLAVGVLEADYRYVGADRAAGITKAVINLSWNNWEPSAGTFNSTYVQSILNAVAQYEGAGMAVSIDPGLQHPPSWVLSAPGGRLVDQNGGTSSTADFEFSNQARSAAAAYIANVVATLPGIQGYRIGLSENGETLYPDTSSNQWWAYSPEAQSGGADLPAGVGVTPMPGWVPGTSTYNGVAVTQAQVQNWYSWYSGASFNAHAWEMSAFRQAGYTGTLQLVMPGMGALPGPMNQRLANDLLPGSYDSYYTLNTAAIWWELLDRLPSLTSTVVDISSVYDWSGSPRGNLCAAGDDTVAYDSSEVYSWSNTRWLASLAGRHGLGVIGENPGNNTQSDLAPMMSLAESCGVSTLQWAWDYTLQSGTGVTAAQLTAAAGITPPPIPPAAFSTPLNVSNNTAQLKIGVSGASQSAGAAITDWWNDGSANESWQFVADGTSTYNLRNANSLQCLTTDAVPGDGLYQEPCDGSAGQVWSTILLPGSPAAETITNPASGLVVDVRSNSINVGTVIDAWYPTGAANQAFGSTGTAVPPAFTTPLNVNNSGAHLKLNVSGASMANGAGITDWWSDGSTNESWQFAGSASGYAVLNAHSGLCLTTDGVIGDQLYQSPCDSSPGQVWATALRPGTSATLTNPSSKLLVDVAGNNINPSATIHGWTATGGANQSFEAF